jgi:hypothetical protein
MRVLGLVALLVAACSAEPNAPKGRVFALSAPDDGEAARRAGCFSAGSSSGAGFGALASAIGGLQRYVERNNDDIPLLFLVEAYGYEGPGSMIELRFLPGEDLGNGAIGLREQTYHDHDLHSVTPSELEAVALGDDQWLDSSAERFHLPEVSVSDHLLELVLESVSFSGKLFADENGLALDGALTGYLSRERFAAESARFARACSEGASVAACTAFGAPLEEAEIESRLSAIAGGFDAELEGGVPSSCSDEACNALSVCLVMSVEPIEISDTHM